MGAEIIVALLSLIGTALGSIVGILTANKLTNYRIKLFAGCYFYTKNQRKE